MYNNNTPTQLQARYKDYQSPQDYFAEYDKGVKANLENDPEFQKKFSAYNAMSKLFEAVEIIKELETDMEAIKQLTNKLSSYKIAEFYRDKKVGGSGSEYPSLSINQSRYS